MSRPFTTIVGVLLLLGAAVHAYRLLHPFVIIVGRHDIPVWYSWIVAAVAAVLGLMVLIESRR